MFLKECKYTEEKVIRHINDNLNDFSSSDESDEEQIKAITLMIFENLFFKSLMKNNFLFNTRFITL